MDFGNKPSLDMMDFSLCLDDHQPASLNASSQARSTSKMTNNLNSFYFTTEEDNEDDDDEEDIFSSKQMNAFRSLESEGTSKYYKPSVNVKQPIIVKSSSSKSQLATTTGHSNSYNNLTEIDSVKHKLSSFWNNVKYGWTRYLKMPNKIDMDSNEPVYILGKKFYSSSNNEANNSSGNSLNNQDLVDVDVNDVNYSNNNKTVSSSFYDFFDASISPNNNMSSLNDSFINTAASSVTNGDYDLGDINSKKAHLTANNYSFNDDYRAMNFSYLSTSPPVYQQRQLPLPKQLHANKKSLSKRTLAPNSKLLNENLKTELEREIYSRLWFTYRKDFEPLNGNYKYTTDCGWGCMLRSSQMLISQGLLMHFFGKDWSLYKSLNTNKDCNLYKELVSLFNDRPSKDCPFGIHRLLEIADKKLINPSSANANATEEEMNTRVGTWFGPTSVCLLVKDALNESFKTNKLLENIRIYVAQDCTIFKKDVIDLCTMKIEEEALLAEANKKDESQINNEANKEESKTDNNNNKSETKFVPCIILVSVRLGGEELNEIYVESLKMFLQMDKCIGIIGGKPRHSLYFIGYQGDRVIYLDPHFCQPTVNVYSATNKQNLATTSLVSSISSKYSYDDTALSYTSSSTSSSSCATSSDFESFDNSTYHCNNPSTTVFTKLDPSLAIGFYCRTLQDLEELCDIIKKTSKSDTLFPIFGVSDDTFEQTQLNYQSFSIDDKLASPSLVNIDVDGIRSNHQNKSHTSSTSSTKSSSHTRHHNDFMLAETGQNRGSNFNSTHQQRNASTSTQQANSNLTSNISNFYTNLNGSTSNLKSSIGTYLTNKINSKLNGNGGNLKSSMPRDINKNSAKSLSNTNLNSNITSGRFNKKNKQLDQDDFVLI